MDNDSLHEMPILGHLEELRKRIIRSFSSVLLVFIILYGFLRNDLLLFILSPLNIISIKLATISPAESFIGHIKVSFYFSLLLCSPHWLYEIWAFVSPGLYKKEKRILLPSLLGIIICFFTGIYFSYKYILPVALHFFFVQNYGLLTVSWSYKYYIDFIVKIFFAFGLGFELPWILFFLSSVGIVSSKTMFKYFRYATVIIFVVSAILTPPDVFTQILLAIPLIFLYLLGVLLAWIGEKR